MKPKKNSLRAVSNAELFQTVSVFALADCLPGLLSLMVEQLLDGGSAFQLGTASLERLEQWNEVSSRNSSAPVSFQVLSWRFRAQVCPLPTSILQDLESELGGFSVVAFDKLERTLFAGAGPSDSRSRAFISPEPRDGFRVATGFTLPVETNQPCLPQAFG
jgi:hypothetical protein